MKKLKMNNFKNSYIVGDFSPSLCKTNAVEIAIKVIKSGMSDWYYAENNIREIIVVDGKIILNGVFVEEGEIAILNRNEGTIVLAAEDSKYVFVRNDSKKDVSAVHNYVEIDKLYGQYYQSVRCLEKQYGAYYSNRRVVDSSEVSVIVQGMTDINCTPFTTKSIRKYLPESKIYLSTWENANLDGCEYDYLIINNDPGAALAGNETMNNGNRQMVSTKEALKKINSPYVLKLRADMMLLSDDILNYIDVWKYKDKEFGVFESKILVGQLFTYRQSSNWIPEPFHVSDWFFFGKKVDVDLIYNNLRLYEESEMGNYKYKYKGKMCNYPWSWRFSPEVQILKGMLDMYFPQINYEDLSDFSDEIIDKSERFILSNFAILGFCQHGIFNWKHFPETMFVNSACKYRDDIIFYTNKDTINYESISING